MRFIIETYDFRVSKKKKKKKKKTYIKKVDIPKWPLVMAYVNLGARLVNGLILVFKSRSSSFQRAQTTIKIYNNDNNNYNYNNNNINKSSIYLIIHLITTVSFFFFFNKVVI